MALLICSYNAPSQELPSLSPSFSPSRFARLHAYFLFPTPAPHNSSPGVEFTSFFQAFHIFTLRRALQALMTGTSLSLSSSYVITACFNNIFAAYCTILVCSDALFTPLFRQKLIFVNFSMSTVAVASHSARRSALRGSQLALKCRPWHSTFISALSIEFVVHRLDGQLCGRPRIRLARIGSSCFNQFLGSTSVFFRACTGLLLSPIFGTFLYLRVLFFCYGSVVLSNVANRWFRGSIGLNAHFFFVLSHFVRCIRERTSVNRGHIYEVHFCSFSPYGAPIKLRNTNRTSSASILSMDPSPNSRLL